MDIAKTSQANNKYVMSCLWKEILLLSISHEDLSELTQAKLDSHNKEVSIYYCHETTQPNEQLPEAITFLGMTL